MILTIFNSVKQFLALSHFQLHFQVLTEAAPPNLAKQDLCEEPVRVIQSPQVSSGVSRNKYQAAARDSCRCTKGTCV